MSVSEFLNANGFHKFEGNIGRVKQQSVDLIKLSSGSNIHMLEIGFNAGHSAELVLKNNPSLTLTSFDLGSHDYVITAKKYIDIAYPNRHTLILGDSTVTIPKYINNNPNKTFDVIFIDGGHQYRIANADLTNCRKLANKDTVVIIDDTNYTVEWEKPWTIGPTKTWTEHLKNGRIIETNRVDYRMGKGMSWGKYVL
jgi:predicted O-methyltransferase YrrM